MWLKRVTISIYNPCSHPTEEEGEIGEIGMKLTKLEKMIYERKNKNKKLWSIVEGMSENKHLQWLVDWIKDKMKNQEGKVMALEKIIGER